MGDGFITRRGGAGSEQALSPTITEVSTSNITIVFTLTNNDTQSAVILYETNDEVPDENSIELAAGATSGNLTITGLTVSPAILYASANVVGKVKSNITEKSFEFPVVIYTAATGGTTAEYDSGGARFKSHTFTSDANFVVTTAGNGDRNEVDYLIIAGGGAGGYHNNYGGGGGAGGYRTTNGTSGGPNPTTESKVVVTAQSYSIDVGAGGAAGDFSGLQGESGNNSLALGVTSLGGGGGGGNNSRDGGSGGSGGGGSFSGSPGSGTNGQGFSGGSPTEASAGGGGAGQVGFSTGTIDQTGSFGGNGLDNLLRIGSNETRAGGGGGGKRMGNVMEGPPNGGSGGGGTGSRGSNRTEMDGQINTGSGGGANASAFGIFGNGGSGTVVIRYEIETV